MTSRLGLVDGIVHTMDPQSPHPSPTAATTAVVAEGDRIIYVGTDQGARELCGRAGDRLVDLAGAHIFPGFTDCHTHFLSFSWRLAQVDLDGVDALDTALAKVAEAVAAAGAATTAGDGGTASRVSADAPGPRKWITGGGFNKNAWADGAFPSRFDLDSVSGGYPVALHSKCGHATWANSEALRLAGVGRDTPDPPGGAIDRDPATGEPTGILKESASGLVWRHVPPAGRDENAQALLKGQAEANSLGLTCVHDCEGAEAFRGFQELRRAGQLDLRVRMMVPAGNLEAASTIGLEPGLGDDYLRLLGVKAFVDGALGAQTALMLEPYEGTKDYTGIATITPETLDFLIGRAAAARFAMAIHAIGDRANRLSLDAFAKHQRVSRAGGLRQRIEHAQLLHPDDLGRFAELGVIASVQPLHATSDRYTADRHWGQRARYAYPFRSLLDHGARMCFGSDAPVETIDPLAGVYAAVTRKRANEPASQPWYPEERLSPMEAVAGYTSWAAYAAYEEGSRGTITLGKLADFSVFDRDLVGGDPDDIPRARPVLTVVGGRVVYQR